LSSDPPATGQRAAILAATYGFNLLREVIEDSSWSQTLISPKGDDGVDLCMEET
jgi:hypothetical protein